jgi:hypothetical protein
LLFVALSAAQPPVEKSPPPFICPMDPEIRSSGPGKCSKCGMRLEPGIREQVEYPLSLSLSPRTIPARRELKMVFHVADPKTGKTVTEFETVHEKLFHLFIVGQDLEYFAHVHPEPFLNGSFLQRATLPKPGAYRLLADYYPSGGVPQLTPKTIVTQGYLAPMTPASLKANLTPKHGSNLDVELVTDPPRPIAGRKTIMFFKLQPGDGLEPYIGAWGHMLAVSNDLIDMIHSHPSIADGGPRVQFDVYFPREATYRVWVQFQRLGKINTVAFTVPVSHLK